jgi:hypothetical protein
MKKAKEFIYWAVEKIGFRREDIIPFVFAVGIAAVFLIDMNLLHNRIVFVMWIILGIVLSALVAWIAMLAGFTVLKSLFLLSAEISLLIFLAQSYCDVQLRSSSADDALRGLIFLGVTYIGYKFFQDLRDALRKRLDSIPEKRWSREKIIAVGLFALFTLSFVWSIFQVVSPIILDLCIYKR